MREEPQPDWPDDIHSVVMIAAKPRRTAAPEASPPGRHRAASPQAATAATVGVRGTAEGGPARGDAQSTRTRPASGQVGAARDSEIGSKADAEAAPPPAPSGADARRPGKRARK